MSVAYKSLLPKRENSSALCSMRPSGRRSKVFNDGAVFLTWLKLRWDDGGPEHPVGVVLVALVVVSGVAKLPPEGSKKSKNYKHNKYDE